MALFLFALGVIVLGGLAALLAGRSGDAPRSAARAAP